MEENKILPMKCPKCGRKIMESMEKDAEEGKVSIHTAPIDEAHARDVIRRAKRLYRRPGDYNGNHTIIPSPTVLVYCLLLQV